MKNFALGRYLPIDSVMHRFDPRAKIAAMLILMIAIFIPAGFIGYGLIGAVVLLGIYLAKMKLNFIWNAMKPMFFMLGFLLIINMLVVKTGTPLITVFGFTVYSDALSQTFYIVVRLVLMITITTTLTATTKPLDLTMGLEDLMSPLKRFHGTAEENQGAGA